MLGYSAGLRYQPRSLGHTATRTIDSSSVIVRTLYVYCDILEHVVVGDIMAPFFRIVNTEVTRSNAVDQIMNPPLVATVEAEWKRGFGFRGNKASAWPRFRQYSARDINWQTGSGQPERKRRRRRRNKDIFSN